MQALAPAPWRVPALPKRGCWLLPRPGREAWLLAMEWAFATGSLLQADLMRGGEHLERRLEGLRSLALPGPLPDGPARDLVERHGVARRRLAAIVDGWSVLLVRQRPRDERQRDALLDLLGGSAAQAFGDLFLGAASRPAALAAFGRGVARAHLLLHAGEHALRGRVVFPESLLEKHGVAMESFAGRETTPGLRELAAAEARECRKQLALAGEVAAEFPPGAAAWLRLLEAWTLEALDGLERRGLPLFDSPVAPSVAASARLLWRARRLAHSRTQDPSTNG
jgi:phytoene/squalene synthetase